MKQVATVVVIALAAIGVTVGRPYIEYAFHRDVVGADKLSANVDLLIRQRAQMETLLYQDRSCFKYDKNAPTSMFIDHDCLRIKWPDRPIVFLIGDSFSASLGLGLRPAVEAMQVNFLQVSAGWCQPTNDNPALQPCDEINALIDDTIRSVHPDIVLMESNWYMASQPDFYRGSDFVGAVASRAIKMWNEGAKRVVVVGIPPFWSAPLPDLLHNNYLTRSIPIPTHMQDISVNLALDLDRRMKEIGPAYLSLTDALCTQDGCTVAIDDQPLDWDYGHLTPAASAYIARTVIMPDIERTIR